MIAMTSVFRAAAVPGYSNSSCFRFCQGMCFSFPCCYNTDSFPCLVTIINSSVSSKQVAVKLFVQLNVS